jgi:hypothetical protein
MIRTPIAAGLAALVVLSCSSSRSTDAEGASGDAQSSRRVGPPARDRELAAAKAKAHADAVKIVNAANHFAINNNGRYPDSLAVLVTPDANGATYLGVRVPPRDPWNNEYLYEPPSPISGNPRPRAVSKGPDGKPGGGDDIDDVNAGR